MTGAGATILQTLGEEFSDLDDVAQVTRLVARLLLAALLGGLLGLQRERHGKARPACAPTCWWRPAPP
jgi:putative Mg2+ transporter-C (MgtC) family protein